MLLRSAPYRFELRRILRKTNARRNVEIHREYIVVVVSVVVVVVVVVLVLVVVVVVVVVFGVDELLLNIVQIVLVLVAVPLSILIRAVVAVVPIGVYHELLERWMQSWESHPLASHTEQPSGQPGSCLPPSLLSSFLPALLSSTLRCLSCILWLFV